MARTAGAIAQPSKSKETPLTEGELVVLKSRLGAWSAAKKGERRVLLRAVVREARSAGFKGDKRHQKKMYKHWLYKHGKRRRSKNEPMKLGKKWTARTVIQHERKDEIMKILADEYGAKPGDKTMITFYQSAVKRVMEGMSARELKKAEETAVLWTAKEFPQDVRAFMAKKHSKAMIKHFCHEMYRQAGMRVFVVSAWQDEEGTLMIGKHDFNHELGGGRNFSAPDDFLETWKEYAAEHINTKEEDQEACNSGVKNRSKRPTFKLELDRQGIPIIPDIENLNREAKKDLVRAFLTCHYRLCCGKPNAVVPWRALTERQSDFVASRYLPTNFTIMEPSKLQLAETSTLLDFWFHRQEAAVGITFTFTAWLNTQGKMIPPVPVASIRSTLSESSRQDHTPKRMKAATKTKREVKWSAPNLYPPDFLARKIRSRAEPKKVARLRTKTYKFPYANRATPKEEAADLHQPF